MSDLEILARGFLDFAEQSIAEGLGSSFSAPECFGEAQHALRIFGKILRKEDERRFEMQALMRLFETDLTELAKTPADMREFRDKLIFAKMLFSSS